MNYTIKIHGKNEKAFGIINMFKLLASDYDFMQILKDDDNSSFMTNEQKKRV